MKRKERRVVTNKELGIIFPARGNNLVVTEWHFLSNEKPIKNSVYEVFDKYGQVEKLIYGNSGFANEPDGFFDGRMVKAKDVIAFR